MMKRIMAGLLLTCMIAWSSPQAYASGYGPTALPGERVTVKAKPGGIVPALQSNVWRGKVQELIARMGLVDLSYKPYIEDAEGFMDSTGVLSALCADLDRGGSEELVVCSVLRERGDDGHEYNLYLDVYSGSSEDEYLIAHVLLWRNFDCYAYHIDTDMYIVSTSKDRFLYFEMVAGAEGPTARYFLMRVTDDELALEKGLIDPGFSDETLLYRTPRYNYITSLEDVYDNAEGATTLYSYAYERGKYRKRGKYSSYKAAMKGEFKKYGLKHKLVKKNGLKAYKANRTAGIQRIFNLSAQLRYTNGGMTMVGGGKFIDESGLMAGHR